MADVVVTAAEVLPDAGSVCVEAVWGGTVTAGQTVYQDTDGTYKAADANASATTANVKGIAMTGGVVGQKGIVCIKGTLDPGFTVGVGTPYFQSATAGGICPAADLAQNMRTTYLGVGKSATQLELSIHNSLTAIP